MTTDWQFNTPYAVPQPGSTVSGGGGYGSYRNALDRLRSDPGRTLPGADYPDGYLGNIVSRREDKLLREVEKRANERPYQRGVHRGSKVAPRDYFWPDTGVRPEAQIDAQMQNSRRSGNVINVPRWAPSGDPVEKLTRVSAEANIQDVPADEKRELYAQYGVDYDSAFKDLRVNRSLGHLRPPWR